MVVVAATRTEARAARQALPPEVTVARVGVGGDLAAPGEPVIVVGLCGALAPLARGTVVIPDEVSTPDGPPVRCDPTLVAALRAAAAERGWPTAGGRQLTSPHIVTGAERARWAAAGYTTVEMEAAPLLARAGGATVRVVLDGPGHELPPLTSPLAMALPTRWPALLRLARSAPRFARRAAEVAAGALAVRSA